MPAALPPKSPRLVPVPQRRSAAGQTNGGGPAGEQLQVKLRRLLNADCKENVFPDPESPVPAPAEYAGPPAPVLPNGAAPQTPCREDKFRFSPGGSLSPGCRDDERTVSFTSLYLNIYYASPLWRNFVDVTFGVFIRMIIIFI